MTRTPLFLAAALSLAATTAYAEPCAKAPPLGLLANAWPAYEAFILEITPPEGRAIDWLDLRAPGLLVRPRADVESTPAAYNTDLFVATLPESSAPALVETAKTLGSTAVFGPLSLSAAWGTPASYRERKSFNFIKSATRNAAGDILQTETGSENTILELRATGFPSTEGALPSSEIKLSWQQVTGWITRDTPRSELAVTVALQPGAKRELARHKEKTMVLTKEPTLVRSVMTECVTLKPGEAILFGGVQGLLMHPDGASDTYRELAILLRKLPK